MTTDSFWFMQLKDVLNLLILAVTIFVIVWGPIKAVEITRANDDRREKRRRQYDIFHSLMKTRAFRLAPEHVMALNLVQLEFYQHERIDAAYRAYRALLARQPQPNDPAEHFHQQRDDALYDLLHEIGQELGYAYDRRDPQPLGYGPDGWTEDEMQQRVLRNVLIVVLTGRRPLQVIDALRVATQMFPPAPGQDGARPNGAADQARPN